MRRFGFAAVTPESRAGLLTAREFHMTKLTTTLVAVALAGLATSALAQGAARPWAIEPGTGYVFAAPGKMSVMSMANANHAAMMKGARKVPNNTVFFMQGDQLYMRTGPMDIYLDANKGSGS